MRDSCGNGCDAIPTILPGTRRRAKRSRAAWHVSARPPGGGFTFAENPGASALEARLIWHARLDPGTVPVEAVPAARHDCDAVDPRALAPWLTAVPGSGGREHVVLSDGRNHIRVDVEAGSLCAGPVILHYRLSGTASAAPRLLPLKRLVSFCIERRFHASLFPRDPRIGRWLAALQVHDGLAAGASLREIGMALYGEERVAAEWDHASDSMRSRVRRLAAEARRLADGGYRSLLRGPP